MTSDQLRKVLGRLDAVLWDFSAERLSDYYQQRPGYCLSELQVKRHLRWMVGTAYAHFRAGRMEKVHRWVGFVQGALWATCHVEANSIMAFRRMNKEQEDDRSVDGG